MTDKFYVNVQVIDKDLELLTLKQLNKLIKKK